jgi:hypothetical protein
LLPDARTAKGEAGSPGAISQGLPASELERETGFEPATLSLGISGVGSRARELAGITCPAGLGESRCVRLGWLILVRTLSGRRARTHRNALARFGTSAPTSGEPAPLRERFRAE